MRCPRSSYCITGMRLANDIEISDRSVQSKKIPGILWSERVVVKVLLDAMPVTALRDVTFLEPAGGAVFLSPDPSATTHFLGTRGCGTFFVIFFVAGLGLAHHGGRRATKCLETT